MRIHGGSSARTATIWPTEPDERESGMPGHRGERDDRRAERAVGDRRVVGDRRDAQRVELGNAERRQDRRDERPGIAEPDQPLEQRAEGPGEQHGLDADVGVPCAMSQRRNFSKTPVTCSVLNSITPQIVIQSTFQMPVAEP